MKRFLCFLLAILFAVPVMAQRPVPGMPAPGSVPPPIPPLVLPPPYQTKPFLSGDATHVLEGVVAAPLITFVVYKIIKHHKKGK